MSEANYPAAAAAVLAINCGSSSLKFAVYAFGGGPGEELRLAGSVEHIGHLDAVFRITHAAPPHRPVNYPIPARDHGEALGYLLDWLEQQVGSGAPAAVGHRVVHGGVAFIRPEPITDAVVAELKRLIPLAPLHLPVEIAAIEALRARYPGVPQVACFDTAFHRSMPRVAQAFGLPRRLVETGDLLRFGFHGLSYEYIVGRLEEPGEPPIPERLIIAHLGNGASMAAVRRGRSVDTTMGLTPIGGLVMSTRSGDLDPGVLIYLLESGMARPGDLRGIVEEQGGLLGVSESSADMQELLARMDADPRAAEAVSLFVYTARKHLAALAAVLGGLDALVFTGGIGEHSAPVRHRMCIDLEFMGIHLDEERNAGSEPVISAPSSPVIVRIIPTNEELMIARHTRRTVLAG